MLNISNLSIHFGGRYLFDNVSFPVGDNDRIGLIGRNGTGKSTLLKIIVGLEQPEEGSITKPNGYTIGYLPQEGIVTSSLSIYDEAKTAMSEIQELDRQIKDITDEISNRTDYDSKEYHALLTRLTEANERYKILGGLSIDSQIETILIGLGFERKDFGKDVRQFSGGWQMRIELAKILLRHPDCILLDEPTNHLDIESIQWLEDFLRNYSGSVIIVSHDRNFLNNVTNRTIEITNGKIYDLALSYSKFIEVREEQRQQLLAAYRNQQKQIEDTEKYIERFRYKATLASRVQSRIKQLEKVERIEIDEEDTSSLRFRFPEPPRSGRLIAEAVSLSKRYGSNLVLDNIDFAIERGEKIAFVGKNGEGKSTLSRILAGLEDYEGNLTIGHNVMTGYFAQHQAELLEGNDTVFDVIDNAATGDMRTRVRSLLGAFLFSGDSVYKKVKILSGGEKSRLAIAKLLLQSNNFLILDEPTNHLDMAAKDVLKNALMDFSGALIIVSHDRDFLNGLTHKTVFFKGGKLKEYPGSIYEFLDEHKIESLKELELSAKTSQVVNPSDNQQKDKIAREKQKIYQREENKIKKQISLCEQEIEVLEKNISELDKLFADSDFYSNPDNVKEKQALYNDYRTLLDQKMNDWAELHEQLENLDKS